MKKLLTLDEVAERLSVQRKHVYLMVRAGTIRGIDVRSKGARIAQWRVSEEDLERFIEERAA